MYKNILIPVVFDKTHDTQASFLAAKALADEDANVTLMHVMEIIPSYAASEIPADVLARSRADQQLALEQLANGVPGSQSVLVSGHAGTTIVEYAKEHEIDCIIVASHRPGFADYFLGSTADRVVRHAKCSVHVIR